MFAWPLFLSVACPHHLWSMKKREHKRQEAASLKNVSCSSLVQLKSFIFHENESPIRCEELRKKNLLLSSCFRIKVSFMNGFSVRLFILDRRNFSFIWGKFYHQSLKNVCIKAGGSRLRPEVNEAVFKALTVKLLFNKFWILKEKDFELKKAIQSMNLKSMFDIACATNS